MEKERILLIGCESKIARLFRKTYADTYSFIGTYHKTQPSNTDDYTRLYRLDLTDQHSVTSFLEEVANQHFKAVLFFASTYSPDSGELLDQMTRDLQVNALSPAVIAKKLRYTSKAGRILFFGDSGTGHPRPNYISYNLSKSFMDSVVRLLAIELSDTAAVLGFRLGPTYAPESADRIAYYERNLIKVADVPMGFIRYIGFIISENDLNMTGTLVDYDGGTYLQRASKSVPVV